MLPHVIITLLSCVTHVTSQFHCQGTCYSGSFPKNKDVIEGKHLVGYSYKNITTDVPQTCFSSCINDCRCKAFQMKDVRCELLDEDKETKPEKFKRNIGYRFYKLRQNLYHKNLNSVNPGECSNGCCQDQPCLNGGTCKEKCQNAKTKFVCSCKSRYHGRVCEKLVESCGDISRGAAFGPKPTPGVYIITRSDTKTNVSVYCSFESKYAWTLIESFSIENLGKYAKMAFHQDFPNNVNAPPTWANYRLSLDMMKYIRSKAIVFSATCDYNNQGQIEHSIDSLYGYLSEYELFNGFDVVGVCFKFKYINIRGQEFFDTSALVWHKKDKYQFHLDCYKISCPTNNIVVNNGKSEDDCFGVYVPVRSEMSKCTAAPRSTTQWWLGEQR